MLARTVVGGTGKWRELRVRRGGERLGGLFFITPAGGEANPGRFVYVPPTASIFLNLEFLSGCSVVNDCILYVREVLLDGLQ